MLQYAMQRHPGMIVDNLVEKNGKKWKNMEIIATSVMDTES